MSGGEEDGYHDWSGEGEAAGLQPEGEPERGMASLLGRPDDEPDDSVSSSSPSLISFVSALDVSFKSFVTPSGSSSSSSSSSSDLDTEVFDLVIDDIRHCEVEEIPSFRWLESPLHRLLSLKAGGGAVGTTRSSDAPAAGSQIPMGAGQLLPSYYKKVLSRVVSRVKYSSLELFYQRLREPILVDEGLKMAWLEKRTGKKCYMLSAMAIGIILGHDGGYWRWTAAPDARFPKVAELTGVCWIEIRASICSRDLSLGTRYGVYLVMRLSNPSWCLVDYPPVEMLISVVKGVQSSERSVQLQDRRREDLLRQSAFGSKVYRVPRTRRDGWIELQIGEFFVEARGVKQLVRVRLNEWDGGHWKSGLILHGVEVRPMP